MDLSEIAAYKRLHQTVVEASQDRETFKQATIYLFNNLIANQGYGNGVYEQKSGDKELSRYEIACHHLNGNIDMIYDYTESPIEKLFLCSLLTVSMRFSPFMIAITAPVVADVFPTKISTFHERNREIKQAFRKEESLAQIADMLELIEELEPAAYSIRCHPECCVSLQRAASRRQEMRPSADAPRERYAQDGSASLPTWERYNGCEKAQHLLLGQPLTLERAVVRWPVSVYATATRWKRIVCITAQTMLTQLVSVVNASI